MAYKIYRKNQRQKQAIIGTVNRVNEVIRVRDFPGYRRVRIRAKDTGETSEIYYPMDKSVIVGELI